MSSIGPSGRKEIKEKSKGPTLLHFVLFIAVALLIGAILVYTGLIDAIGLFLLAMMAN